MTRKVAIAVLLVALAAGGCSNADPNSQAPSVTTSFSMRTLSVFQSPAR